MTDSPELMPMNTEANIAVMRSDIQNIKGSLERIEKAGLSNVPRTEWEQHNAYVESRFTAVLAELAARRAPWWSVAALLIAALALADNYIPFAR